MKEGFADRVTQAVAAKRAPCVVNIDPVAERLPPEFRTGPPDGASSADALEGIAAFCSRVLHIVAPIIPIVKINVAYFEPYRAPGIEVYDALVDEAARLGLLVIGDVKRGDVGHTAAMYAKAQTTPHPPAGKADRAVPDAVTINGYFGYDGVKPFIETARETGKGVFVLVRTSNPSAAAIQDVATHDGRKVHEIVAALVAEWAEAPGMMGACGYSALGAVVATRSRADAARLRAAMPRSIFLVPGYGAQGGEAEDFQPYFHPGGAGALVAAGRSVIFAHESPTYQSRFADDWRQCVEAACRDFTADIARIAATASKAP